MQYSDSKALCLSFYMENVPFSGFGILNWVFEIMKHEEI
jgi:hypothetical protein